MQIKQLLQQCNRYCKRNMQQSSNVASMVAPPLAPVFSPGNAWVPLLNFLFLGGGGSFELMAIAFLVVVRTLSFGLCV